MVYIKINEKNEVIYKHFCPFDEQHGLGKTLEELEKEGKLVNDAPAIKCPSNKMAIEKYNHETNEIYYELVDRNPNYIEGKISILEEENKKLKEVTKDQDKLLVDNIYKITMLEMNSGGM